MAEPKQKAVEANIQISVPPQKALAAFTEFELLKGWWGVEKCLVEKHPGGTYALAWGITKSGFQYISCGTVEKYNAGDFLQIGNFCYFNPERQILGGMALSISVAPHKNGTELQLIQNGYRQGGDWDWYYESVKKAWPMALQQMKSFLEK